jgi:dolichyl-phosphate-mannose-protein mannosyltransferase
VTQRATDQPRGRRIARWDLLDTTALSGVTVLATLLRLVRLDDPRTLVFDETYYAKDACWYAFGSRSLCDIDAEQTQVHPPLGKWLISAGVKLFGYDSFGWRVGAALAGIITVALLYVLARRLLGSTMGATLAAGLLAVDFLHFVQSRIAMLDVFVTLFGVTAILFLVLDRDGLLLRDPERLAPAHRTHSRPWRWAAGAAAGAAAASKWSGALYALTVVVLGVAWELRARRGTEGRWLRVAREQGPSLLLALVVVPLGVYVVSYAARLGGDVAALPWEEGAWLRSLWERQLYMLDFHTRLTSTHPYQSPAWSWLLLRRPVSYYFETDENGDYLEILATGSPLVWWMSALALAYVLWRWIQLRDGARPEGVIVAAFGCNYVPWLLLGRGRPAVFLFYLAPALPFMCLALAYVPARFSHLAWMGPAVVGSAAIVLALFAFYYPILANTPIPRSDWLARIWVFDGCERPPPTRSAGEVAGTKTGSGPRQQSDLPPAGWCWI